MSLMVFVNLNTDTPDAFDDYGSSSYFSTYIGPYDVAGYGVIRSVYCTSIVIWAGYTSMPLSRQSQIELVIMAC